MVIEDTFTIDAPINDVWDFFLDIDRLSACVPGVEHVEQVSDTVYEGSLKAKVGPIAATFGGSAEITEQTPPNHITAAIKAKDKRTASLIKGGFDSTLSALAPAKTEVAYKIDVAIRGKMGTFGQTVIKDTAKAISAIFVDNVRNELEQPTVEAVAAEEPMTSASATTQPAPPKAPAAEPNLVWVVIKSVFSSIARAIRNLFSRN